MLLASSSRSTIPGMALAAFVSITLNLFLPGEGQGLAINAPAFDAECQAGATKEATAEARQLTS